MKIALVQMNSVSRKEDNVERAVRGLERASAQGAEIACLHELFSTEYFCAVQDVKYFDLAEPIPGPTIARLTDAARNCGISVIAPIFELDTELPGTYYNSAAVIDKTGRLVGKYRKTHIPQLKGYQERFYFKPGNLGYPVFDVSSCRLGVIICYDRHFQEGPRIMTLKGAQILFVPSCTGFYPEAWDLELRAHAAFNTIFVAGVNRCGSGFPGGRSKYFGRSLVANPMGEVVALAGSDEETLVVDVDLGEVAERRKIAPFLRDRRPELYGDLARLT